MSTSAFKVRYGGVGNSSNWRKMKLSSFFVFAKCVSPADFEGFDARCPDLELGQQCDTECSVVFVECRNKCDNHPCENQCLVDLGECVSDCPCGQNCQNGCEGCDHPLCQTCENLETDFEFQQCKVKALQEFDQCAMDCLNDWSCIDNCYSRHVLQGFSDCKCFDENPSKNNEFITLLSEDVDYRPANDLTYVTNAYGGFQENRHYSYAEYSLLYTVSAIYQDNVFIFGGNRLSTYIHQVIGCDIRQLSVELQRGVDHFSGIVATSNGVYTGFRNHNFKWTQLFDGSRTTLVNYETYADHEYGCIASLNDQPVAIGGDGGTYVEILRSNGWTRLASHPKLLFHPGCLRFGEDMLTIGGYDEYESSSPGKVYIYKGQSGYWSFLGNLLQVHYLNTVIELNGLVYSVGFTHQPLDYGFYSKYRKVDEGEFEENHGSYRNSNSNEAGIERIQINNSSIFSEIISSHDSFGHLRPVLFPSGQYDCAEAPTPTTSITTSTTTTTTSTPFLDVECYDCSDQTINDVNMCSLITETVSPMTCKSDVGCFSTHVIAFSENYPGGKIEIMTRGCLEATDKLEQGCFFYKEGDIEIDENGDEILIENDSEICSIICRDTLCNGGNEFISTPKFAPTETP